MFSLICARINGWVNNGEAGDLGRHGALYEVTVMLQENFVENLAADNLGRRARTSAAMVLTMLNKLFHVLHE